MRPVPIRLAPAPGGALAATGRILRAALAFVLLLCAAGAAAQGALPDETVPTADRDRFRLCRAAAYYHLDGAPNPDARVPRAVALALRDQIGFVMFETLRGAPAGALDDAGRAMAFTEQFFLSFAETITAERGRLSRLEERERVLLDCVPFVWRVMASRIDHLMRWRARAIAEPPDP